VAAEPSTTLLARLRKRALKLARRLLLPDPQVLWLPHAGAALLRSLFVDGDADVVFISGPPFSQFLLAWVCRLRGGTAVVLDYRDEWTTQSGYEMGGSARLGALLEGALLRSCHAVTTATEAFRTQLLERFTFLEPSSVHAIPNGYDPDDFPSMLANPPKDHLVLSYVGTVFRLTSARGLLEGVRLLHEREPALAALLRVQFIGRIVATEVQPFENMEALGVRRLGYLAHHAAIEELARSHVVLCLLANVAGAARIYPAKIFELMYLGRPCLALAPEGALATLVRHHHLGEVVAPEDSEAICEWLARRLRAFRDGDNATSARDATWRHDIARFHRNAQAGDFADVFRAAAAKARRGSGVFLAPEAGARRSRP
jgi:hypothetical protein